MGQTISLPEMRFERLVSAAPGEENETTLRSRGKENGGLDR